MRITKVTKASSVTLLGEAAVLSKPRFSVVFIFANCDVGFHTSAVLTCVIYTVKASDFRTKRSAFAGRKIVKTSEIIL
jgi:hypothetical protein